MLWTPFQIDERSIDWEQFNIFLTFFMNLCQREKEARVSPLPSSAAKRDAVRVIPLDKKTSPFYIWHTKVGAKRFDLFIGRLQEADLVPLSLL